MSSEILFLGFHECDDMASCFSRAEVQPVFFTSEIYKENFTAREFLFFWDKKLYDIDCVIFEQSQSFLVDELLLLQISRSRNIPIFNVGGVKDSKFLLGITLQEFSSYKEAVDHFLRFY